jgi:hypothetical protein
MTNRAARAAIAIVRAWTWLYTWGLPRADRERRRLEIESDLWESGSDEEVRPSLVAPIIARLLLGIPDDVRWRIESTELPPSRRHTVATAVTAAVLLTLVVVGAAALRVDPPQPPEAPEIAWRHRRQPAPTPPPPPPPPCNPPGIGRAPFSPCTPIDAR